MIVADHTHEDIYLIETKSSDYSLRIKCKDGTEKVLHSLYDPIKEAKMIVDASEFDGNGMLVVLGLGLGYHLLELLRRYPDAEIVVIEAVQEIYQIAKENSMLQEVDDKVKFIVGVSIEEAIKETTRKQLKAGMRPLSVIALPSVLSVFPEYYHPLLTKFKETNSVKLWDRLKYPKFKKDVVKIVLLDLGYFLIREVADAVKRAGHRVLKVPMSPREKGEVIVSRVINTILEFKPDLFLTINHLGFDEQGVLTSFLRSIEMPVASWYVDSPNLIVKAFEKNVSPNISIFLWDKAYLKDMESMGYESVSYLPLAADEKVFMPINLNKKKHKKYRCDVGFVGTSMMDAVNKWLSKVDKKFHPLIERVADDPFKLRGSIKMLLKGLPTSDKEMIDRLGKREKMDLEAAIIWKATLEYRLSCLKTLQGVDMRIHGDAGWRRLLDSNFRLYPSLNYYNDLPSFYNACEVNFNATSLQMGEAVNQRVFDVPACGSFLLTDHQKDLEDLFDIGKEVVSYSNIDEIQELVKFYLKNQESREVIAKRGRERVLKEHTYRHRLDTIIHSMKKRYG